METARKRALGLAVGALLVAAAPASAANVDITGKGLRYTDPAGDANAVVFTQDPAHPNQITITDSVAPTVTSGSTETNPNCTTTGSGPYVLSCALTDADGNPVTLGTARFTLGDSTYGEGTNSFSAPTVGPDLALSVDGGGIDVTTVINGSSDDDVLTGAATINGGDGDDVITTAQTVNGGAGDDNIRLSSGFATTVDAGPGDDYVEAGGDVQGGDGNDVLIGTGTLDGGNGNDTLQGVGTRFADGTGRYVPTHVTLKGGPGDDTLDDGDNSGSKAPSDANARDDHYDSDVLDGGSGSDTVTSYENRTDSIFIGLDQGPVSGSAGEGDTLVNVENVTTGSGNDHLEGSTRDDDLSGGAGDDVIYGDAGNDGLHGGPGNDYLDGGAGNDLLEGGIGDDVLYSHANDMDELSCGAGTDSAEYLGAADSTSDTHVDNDCENRYFAGPPAATDVTAPTTTTTTTVPAATKPAAAACTRATKAAVSCSVGVTSARATLLRSGKTVAHGAVKAGRIRLRSAHRLRAGHYTLVLRSGRTVTRQHITIR